MSPEPPIGIDAIQPYVPRCYLEMTTLARANQVDAAKYTRGLGLRRMAVPSPYEDPVTMAVQAARRLKRRFDVDWSEIGLLIVASETPVDASKATAAYVHGLLGMPTACRVLDVKQACYGATAAIRLALGWCDSPGHRNRRKALVIATDIACYETGSPGEPTQGAGAVAMVIACSPRILAIDPFPEAVFTEDTMDFWRPCYRRDAVVNGALSVKTYLKALDYTYSAFKAASGLSMARFDYLLFHVPFPKMAYKAYTQLYHRDTRPSKRDTRQMNAGFERQTAPGLYGNREVGNLYTGSLYLSLATLVERTRRLFAKRVGFFSYGSGACAEFFSGRLAAGADAYFGSLGLDEMLRSRREISLAEYHQMRMERDVVSSPESVSPHRPISFSQREGVCFLGIRDHQRVYSTSRLAETIKTSHRDQTSAKHGADLNATGAAAEHSTPTRGATCATSQ